MSMKIQGGGFVTEEAKTETINGVEVGVVEGYIASFEIEDNPFPDKFLPGAFVDSINEHKKRGNRGVRLNYMHKRDPIGVFPIETVYEDRRGLFGKGHINLAVEKGREVYALAKQGAITDFSIGYRSDPEKTRYETLADGRELRLLAKADILEGSLVDEPMNKDAQVVSVKAENAITIEELGKMSPRALESVLSDSGLFSRKAAAAIVAAAKVAVRQEEEPVALSPLMEALRLIRSDIAGVG